MGRSQRHMVRIQGVSAAGRVRENDVVGNTLVAGAVNGPLSGSRVPGPVRPAQPQLLYEPDRQLQLPFYGDKDEERQF